MATPPRMTIPTQLVLAALLQNPTSELYGVEIGAAAGLPSGTVHPILARLEGVGRLESRWEAIDPREAGGRNAVTTNRPPPASTAARAALAGAYRPSTRRPWL